VHVHNSGTCVLRSGEGAGKVQVAARWHDLDGTPTGAATYTDLPFDLPPAATARFLVPVRAHDVLGHAMLQFLVVQGGVWLETADLAAGRVVARVLPRMVGPDGGPSSLPPAPTAQPRPWSLDHDPSAKEAEVEFYSIPVAEIVAEVQAAGGELLDVAENDWSGPGWISASYTVRKR
jgi:hypothetical protein